MGDIKIPTPDRRTWAIIILMVAVALQPNAVGYVDPTGGLQDLSFEPKQPRFDFTRALKLAVVPLSINFRDLTTPFWKLKQYQQNPLRQAYACADQFGPSLKTASRVAFFTNSRALSRGTHFRVHLTSDSLNCSMFWPRSFWTTAWRRFRVPGG